MPTFISPIMIQSLAVPLADADQSSSFLSLDSPTSVCSSSLSMRDSKRTSHTSFPEMELDMDEDEEQGGQFAVYGLHMQTRSIDFEGEDLAHDGEEDAEPGRADSPTTGDFEAIHSAGHSSHFQNTPTHSTQGSASGSSWSSSRRMGAPSVCLSFRSNGQFQLSSPPSRRTCSSRKSNSTLSSHFSFSAAQQLAAANQAARASLIGGAASTSVASSHRHSQASMASDIQSSSPQQHMQAGRIKDEPETLTPAQELIRAIRKKEEDRASRPIASMWDEALRREMDDVQETLESESQPRPGSAPVEPAQGGKLRSTFGKLNPLRRRTRSNASATSSLRSEIGRGFI